MPSFHYGDNWHVSSAVFAAWMLVCCVVFIIVSYVIKVCCVTESCLPGYLHSCVLYNLCIYYVFLCFWHHLVKRYLINNWSQKENTFKTCLMKIVIVLKAKLSFLAKNELETKKKIYIFVLKKRLHFSSLTAIACFHSLSFHCIM